MPARAALITSPLVGAEKTSHLCVSASATMTARLVLALLTLCLGHNLFCLADGAAGEAVDEAAGGACEKEEDLDFEKCDLKDLKDDVLKVRRSCS